MMSAAMLRTPRQNARPTPSAAVKPAAPVVATAPRRRRRLLPPLLLPPLLLIAAMIGAIGWYGLERQPGALCRQWEREARTADGERLSAIIQRLDAYGRYGLPSIVRLLAADREATVEAAGEALRARLRLVGRHREGDDRAAATLIADELQRLVAGRTQPVSPATIEVALELLEAVGRLGLADAVADDDRSRMLTACDAVLRLSPAQPETPLKTLIDVDRPPASPSAVVVLPPTTEVMGEAGAGEGGSTTQHDARPTTPTITSVAPTPTPPLVEPTEPATIAANTAARINPIREAEADQNVRPAAATTSLPPTAAPVRTEPSRSDAWSLFAALHDADAGTAEQELRRRGFTSHEIELGRQLGNPNVEVRRSYAARLPSLGDIDVRPWLLHLSRDPDDEIRLTVAAIMATSGDPELQARVRSMSIDDRDERVRATAARAVDSRTLRR